MAETALYTTYLVLAAVSASLVGPVAFSVRRRTRGTAHEALSWCLLAILWTLLSNIFEILAPDFRSTLAWSFIGYAGLVMIPPTALLFALGYTGRERHGRAFLVFIVPVVTLALLATNGLHHLHWASVAYRRVGPYSALSIAYGPWFWVLIVHQYALLIGGAAMVSVDFFASRRFYSLQARCVVFGAIAPLAFNALYIFRLLPGVTKDFTPVAFALSGLAFGIGVRRYRLFDLMPVAYRAAFDAMADPVFIVDAGGRLVDMNAAAGMVGLRPDDLGRPVAELPAAGAAIRSATEPTGGRAPSELSLDTAGGPRWFEAVARTLGAGPGARTLYALRDVTERRAMFLEKSELVDKLTAALAEINDLRGIIPVCAKCKKMRDDEGYWQQLEDYLSKRADLRFTHGLCPECAAQILSELEDRGAV